MERNLAEARLKGVGVEHLSQFIRINFGEDGWKAVHDAVSPETARILALPVAYEWYPLRQVVEIEREVIRRFYGGDVMQGQRFGRYSLQQSIARVYRVLFRMLETAFLIKKSATLWRTFLDQGRLEIEQPDGRHAILRVIGLDPVHEVYCHDLRGSFLESLVACGAKQAEVTHTECVLKGAPACVYKASW